MRLTVRRALLLTTLLAVGLLAFTASAFAAIDLGGGEEPPSIAYDSGSGDTYVVWRDSLSEDTLDVCVVPSGGSACNSGSGPYKLTDPLAASGGSNPVFRTAKVLVAPGGTVVVLTNVEDGNVSVKPSGYPEGSGVVAWSSAAGGAAFASGNQGIATNGKLLAEAPAYMPSAGAVALNATEFAVYGNTNPFSNGVTDFSLIKAAPSTTPIVDQSGAEKKGEYSDQENVEGNEIAVEPDAGDPGKYVVVVGGGAQEPAPVVCQPGGGFFATGYGVATGTPKELQMQTAWSSSYFTPLSCEAAGPALAEGPSGIGALESEGAGYDSVNYRAFEAASAKFGAPVQVSNETGLYLVSPDDFSLSQDSAGGVYAMWGDERGVEFNYSNTAGASWPAPVGLGDEAGDPVLAGVGGGNAEVAYTADLGDSSDEYLQPFSYTELLAAEQSPPVTTPRPTTPTPTPPVIAPLITTLPSPTITQTVTVEGDNVSLSAPNQCVRNGIVNGVAKVTVPSAHRKGKYVVKIYEAIFKVDGKTLIIKRKHLSPAPFKVKIHLKHVKPGTKLVLTAHLLIAVHHGPKRSKTLRVTLTTCA
jgi:hypothetical protein